MICRNSVSIFVNQLTRLLRAVTGAWMEETMRHRYVIGVLLAALTLAGSARLSAQDSIPGDWHLLLIPDGKTVYDVVNHVTWLADANLPAKERFGLPLCDVSSTEPTEPCVNLSGSMNYESAEAWLTAMNNANYLGHSDWQLPTTPFTDPSCAEKGKPGNSFGFGCDANALGYLYHTALGFQAPNTAVPIPPNQVGPFRNFQPNLYWSHSPGGGLRCNVAVFNFASGAQGGSCGIDFLDVLPMIDGKIPGTPPAVGLRLQVNPGGETIYDPVAGVTWLADANLAGNDTLGLPHCETPTTPTLCVALDGSMDYASAKQFILNMNAYDQGAGYLGQTTWELPSANAKCPLYNCSGKNNPMGELFYIQLGKTAGEPVVEPPDIAVGPFRHLQPFPYWSCQALTIQEACEAGGPNPPTSPPAEWGFSFGNGLLGTSRLPADHVVMVYFPGCDLQDPWTRQ
jgi:hypothetical protein